VISFCPRRNGFREYLWFATYGVYSIAPIQFSTNFEPIEVVIANALQLEGRPTSYQSFWAVYFIPICTAHAHKLLFSACDLTAPLDSATLISWRSDDVFTLWCWPLTTWPWTFTVHRVSLDEIFHPIWSKSNSSRLSYSDFNIEKFWGRRPPWISW